MFVPYCTPGIHSNEVRYCLYVQSACPMTVQSQHAVTDSSCDTDAALILFVPVVFRKYCMLVLVLVSVLLQETRSVTESIGTCLDV
jgi:hypothetical protein